jgi:hypothetical protein
MMAREQRGGDGEYREPGGAERNEENPRLAAMMRRMLHALAQVFRWYFNLVRYR